MNKEKNTMTYSHNYPDWSNDDPLAPWNEPEDISVFEKITVKFYTDKFDDDKWELHNVVFKYSEFSEHIHVEVMYYTEKITSFPFWEEDIETNIREWCYQNLSRTKRVLLSF